MFIRFINAKLDQAFVTDLLFKLEGLFTDAKDKLAAKDLRESLKEHNIEGYRLTQSKIKDQVDYLIKFKRFEDGFAQWANFFLSALRENVKEDRNGDIERQVHIGTPTGDWVTGLIVYNFSLFCKYYGLDILKRCTVCSTYFTVKGKYATYCSDGCKKVGPNKEKGVDNPEA